MFGERALHTIEGKGLKIRLKSEQKKVMRQPYVEGKICVGITFCTF